MWVSRMLLDIVIIVVWIADVSRNRERVNARKTPSWPSSGGRLMVTKREQFRIHAQRYNRSAVLLNHIEEHIQQQLFSLIIAHLS